MDEAERPRKRGQPGPGSPLAKRLGWFIAYALNDTRAAARLFVQSTIDTGRKLGATVFAVAILTLWTGILVSPFFLLWLFSDYLPFQQDVTVYHAACDSGFVEGRCSTDEQPAESRTYRPAEDAQAVIYWSSEGGSVVRLPGCAVKNAANWTCKHEARDQITTDEMIGGNFHHSSDSPFDPEEDLTKRIVTKRQWWFLWLQQELKNF